MTCPNCETRAPGHVIRVNVVGQCINPSCLKSILYARMKNPWETPTMKEDHACSNCDGAPDGGHTSDILCSHWEFTQ